MALHTKSELFFCLLLFVCLMPVAACAENVTETAMSYSGQQYQGSIDLFRPASDSIPSAQVNDMINGLQGEVLMATPLGLSTYNGIWSTQHINLNNVSEGLMNNYVTALEYDSSGNLWIGYGSGIQIYNGHTFQVIGDQQLFKSLRIRYLQRWNDDMWVATGNAGLNRYHNGTWTWFAPFSHDGPGFYEADSMALDSATDTLLIATDDEGLWKVTPSNDTVRFDKIEDEHDLFGLLGHVRRDPLGGAYFFNSTQVAHYDSATGFTTLLTERDFDGGPYAINDVTGGSDGTLYVATDNGIYVWEDGIITRHLGTFEGFGTGSHRVRTVFADAGNRLWFSTLDNVGYYTMDLSTTPLITIETVTPTSSPTPVPVNISQAPTPDEMPPPAAMSPLNRILAFLSGLFPFLQPSR